MKKNWIALLLALLLTSCATRYLWDHTNTYVAVAQSDACEHDLNARHVKYIRSNVSNVLFVEKSGIDKCKTYAIRLIAAPFTVAVDASTAVLVVGGGAFLFVKSKDGGAGAMQYSANLLNSITDKIEQMRTGQPNNSAQAPAEPAPGR
ncbi:MAG: hypothetical protein WCS01_11765 [bacterium]